LVLLTFVGLGTTSNKNLSKAKYYITLFIDDCRNKINHLDDQHGGVWMAITTATIISLLV